MASDVAGAARPKAARGTARGTAPGTARGTARGTAPGTRRGTARGTAPGTARVEGVSARAFTVPTATDEESDGTLTWDSTSIVLVEAHAAGSVGLGFTYCDPAAAAVVNGKLGELVEGCDALMPGRAWETMQRQVRQLGHAGVAAMALSAVDVALWDLKGKLLGVCLADLLPRVREAAPIYGSGGFCDYTETQLREQAAMWMEEGVGSVKIKVGRDTSCDLERLAAVRSVVGADVDLMVDGNGAYSLQDGLLWAERFAERGVSWFEEPLSSLNVDGLAELRARAPGGLAVAAGEYAWNLHDLRRMLEARCVHVLQADVTRCGGITGMLRADGLCEAWEIPFSAHCAPAISAHVCCAMESLLHVEHFFDHVRIERMLFDGAQEPDGGALRPDRDRPGLGLELVEQAAAPYEVKA